ncbi:hypothetical protein HK096_011459, partial [Nowakowskiella sp. JEL0078]
MNYLTNTAHGLGLTIGLKNTPSMVSLVVGQFDFAVVESCAIYNECKAYLPFVEASKPVFAVEYNNTGGTQHFDQTAI